MKTEQELKEIFGKNVKTLRIRRDWSQENLAEKAGVTRNAISDIEVGDTFAHAKTIVLLAKAFETEVYELFKPEGVLPDNSAGVLAKYDEDVRDALDKVKDKYLKKMKK